MRKHVLMTVLCAAASLAWTSASIAQPEKPQPAARSGDPAAKRVILPGDLLNVRVGDPNKGTGPSFQVQVNEDGSLSTPGVSFTGAVPKVDLSGLSEKQAADRIAKAYVADSVYENPIVTVTFAGEHVAAAVGAVRLIVDPTLATLDLTTAVSLTQVSRILKPAAAAAALDPNRCLLTVTPIVYTADDTVGRRGGSMSIHVEAKVKGGTEEEAAALMKAACDQVAANFNAFGEKEKEPLRQKLEQAQEDRRRVERELRDGQSVVTSVLGDYASVADYLKAIQALRSEEASLRVSAECDSLRERILTDKLKTIRAQMAEGAKTDALAAELEKVVSLREQALKATEEYAKGGRATQSELGEAQEKLALAKAELLRRREEVGRSSGGEQLAQLAQQLTTAEIARRETALRLQMVQSRLADMKTDEKVKILVELKRRIEEVEGSRQEYLEEERELARAVRGGSPIVAIPAIVPDPAPRKAPATRPAR